jgi:hypothetical protein
MSRHHTAEQKSEIVGKFEALRDKGVTTPEAAKKAGVAYLTLRRWINAGVKPASPPKRGREASRKQQSTGLITLTFPDGYKVEAEDPDVIVQILKGLGK